MSKIKVFWISFAATMLVVLPLYLLAFALDAATGGARPTENSQSAIWVAQATAADAYTVLVMSGSGGAQTAEHYTLVRFDAYKNGVSVCSLPPETVVLSGGKPVTLADTVTSAGPAQATAALAETLAIPVDNYLYASPKFLWQTAEAFGNIQMRLGGYASAQTLTALGLDAATGDMQAVSPRVFAQVLAAMYEQGGAQREQMYALRAHGYLLFLAAGHGGLKTTLPDAVRSGSNAIATNLTATQLYDYTRALQFLDRQEPTYTAEAMPGTWERNGKRFELNEEAIVFAAKYFA